MNAIEIIGDPTTVLAFALGGVPGRVAETADEARAAIEAVVNEVRSHDGPVRSPTLLLVTQGTADRIREYLDGVILDASGPLVVEIPGFGEPQRKSPVARFVARVLGIHL
jgi:vacuolar-type H+-ATPase subunit F/Vma7